MNFTRLNNHKFDNSSFILSSYSPKNNVQVVEENPDTKLV
jgi:hypothetical protein